jgi:hypothetical protein
MSRSFIPRPYTLLYIVLILHSNIKSGVPNGVFFLALLQVTALKFLEEMCSHACFGMLRISTSRFKWELKGHVALF